MNKIWLLAATACFVLAFGSCKPKQSAYKAAYEQAKEKETTAPVTTTEYAFAEDTYEEEEIAPVSKPRTPDVESRSERITAAEGEDASRLRRYSVVIGSFVNKTNAYSLKERMENEGYNVVLGENEQGMLRVIISSFDDKADAATSRDAIKSKYAPNFQDAWLLDRMY